MATYTIKDLKDTDFQDPHGNHWMNAAFSEFGEPVVLVVKDPSKYNVGTSLEGEIKQIPKKSGNGTYNRFFRDKPQDFAGGSGGNFGSPKPAYVPRDDSAIQAQWSIGQAVTVALDMGQNDTDFIEGLAKEFYLMIDRVKNTPKEITAGAIHEAAKTLQLSEDDSKPVDVSDIPF